MGLNFYRTYHTRLRCCFSASVWIVDFFFKKIHFSLDSNENCCTFAVFYSTNTLTQNITT